MAENKNARRPTTEYVIGGKVIRCFLVHYTDDSGYRGKKTVLACTEQEARDRFALWTENCQYRGVVIWVTLQDF